MPECQVVSSQIRLIYQLAIETGLRWNEVRTLCRKDFSFTGNPYLSVRAENAKNEKTDHIPLLSALAAGLVAYFKEHPALPAAPVFSGMWTGRGGEMLAEDLVEAGIEVKNSAGEVLDFHSLRHTCGTRLARNGVQPQVAMRISAASNHGDLHKNPGFGQQGSKCMAQ